MFSVRAFLLVVWCDVILTCFYEKNFVISVELISIPLCFFTANMNDIQEIQKLYKCS